MRGAQVALKVYGQRVIAKASFGGIPAHLLGNGTTLIPLPAETIRAILESGTKMGVREFIVAAVNNTINNEPRNVTHRF